MSTDSVSEALKLNSPGLKYHRRQVEIWMSTNKLELKVSTDLNVIQRYKKIQYFSYKTFLCSWVIYE